ncbi:DUF2127 domain-containing protein [Aerolutibacter ruishenii]|uniref:Uncharacterized membrane protein (DUF2068 family) n=1 Tax=Aerolutibacter ruishenii TaxID=686800 RepID=A0A562LKK6_9GAMM|nr:DUF2127 domain-containing protein [Lysobacter ruishenii]TWI08142.1 uncharacterized membrane protein (DUF2068 family) [Lysobacter ruishenii]
MEAQSQYNPDPHAHPGLHAIAVFEAAKGLVALLAAVGLVWAGPAVLQHALDGLAAKLHLNPSHGPVASLLRGINPESIGIAVAVTLAYALMRFVEAWGLWQAKAWGSWLGCIGAAVYLPFELYALIRRPGWLEVAVLTINLLVVWILGRDLAKRRR